MADEADKCESYAVSLHVRHAQGFVMIGNAEIRPFPDT